MFRKAVLIGFILGLAPALTGAASALTLQEFLMSLAIAKVLRYPVTVSGLGLLVAFAASALSGIVAVIYPSFKATQIHPVDIIRS
jgi:ABC-type antimicrobial peptide transport system permease subunit